MRRPPFVLATPPSRFEERIPFDTGSPIRLKRTYEVGGRPFCGVPLEGWQRPVQRDPRDRRHVACARQRHDPGPSLLAVQRSSRGPRPEADRSTDRHSNLADVRGGMLVSTAGQVRMNPSGSMEGAGEYRPPEEQVFRSLGSALGSAGPGLGDLVKPTHYALELGHLPEFRQVRDRFVDASHPPVGGGGPSEPALRPEFLLQVNATAAVE